MSRIGILSLLLLIWSAYADTIILNDGQKVEGTVVDETDGVVTLKVKFGTVKYKRSEIKEIQRAAAAGVGEASTLRDVLILNNGDTHRGLIFKEDAESVTFDVVVGGNKVSNTMLARTRFGRGEIKEIKPLTAEQRQAARTHLERIADDKSSLAMARESINIQSITWPAEKGGTIPARKVDLDHFVIESDAPEEFVREAAVRLGQVTDAYKRHFGTDRNPGVKVKVNIFRSMDEYYHCIGHAAKNPAFYSPNLKLIAAGCDVEKYQREIARIREYHAKLNKRLEDYKKEITEARQRVQALISRIYDETRAGDKGTTVKGQIKRDAYRDEQTKWQLFAAQREKEAQQVQDEIAQINRRNDTFLTEYTKEMFAMLYHEGFHAYLDNFLFPDGISQFVPRWLNEGLAQYFEFSRIEADKFVLGQESRAAMAILRQFNKDGSMIPLEKLMDGKQQDYLIHTRADVKRSTANYLQSWLLVHWLGEHDRLTKANIDQFVGDLAVKTPVLEALVKLTGISNAELTKQLEEKLRPKYEAPAK